MIEKRQFTRVAFDASARLIRGEDEWPSRLLDISLKGALLELPKDGHPREGDPVVLYLVLSDEVTEIRMEGHVAHVGQEQMGVVCDNLDVESASHLRRIVELNTGSEALLEREFEALINLAQH